jgi:hypothetical protein
MKILFRASCIGLIMTKPRTGTGLSETCKTYLSELATYLKYGRIKDIQNKYIIKGLEVEKHSIDLYSDYKKEFFLKNDQWFSNDFISGTPDIIKSDKVIDIKSAWDVFTFNKNKDNLNKNYKYQVLSYCALTGKDKGTLAYCLTNTPDPLIQDEKRKQLWKMAKISDTDPDYLEACAEIDKLCLYDDIPLEERVHEIEIERDEKEIEKIYTRVEECRTYMKKTFNI